MSAEVDYNPLIRACYSQGGGIYRIVPVGVAWPGTVADVRALLTLAREQGVSLIPRGAGSAMAGSNVGEGVVVDLSHLEPGPVEIDPLTMTARVSPSLRAGALQAAALPHGLRFPPDPASTAWATLAGMVSTNAGGPRSVRYGTTRDWIQALTLETFEGPLYLERGLQPDPSHPRVSRWQAELLPRLQQASATIHQRWPALVKNSFGYNLGAWLRSGDLLDLVIGSEGTLGIISGITCRLAVIPAHRLTLQLVLPERASLVPAIQALQQAGASSVEFFDRTFLRWVDAATAGAAAASLQQGDGAILADLEGDDPEQLQQTAAQVVHSLADCLSYHALAGDAATIERLWELRRGASPALARLGGGRRSLQVIEDGVVPISHLPEYLELVERVCAEEDIPVVLFGHAGNGHVHANILPDLSEPDWRARTERIYQRVNQSLATLGGVPSGEHGVGRLRAPLLETFYGSELTSLMRQIKSLFDPWGLLNPGVVLGDADPLTHLKVGADAVPLPDGIAEWLQRIEAQALWGRGQALSEGR